MPIQAVGTETKLLHEREMAGGHVEILRLSRQLPCARQDGAGHKHRIAHLFVQRHGFPHFTGRGKTEISSSAHQRKITTVVRTLGQVGKHKLARKRREVGRVRLSFEPSTNGETSRSTSAWCPRRSWPIRATAWMYAG